MVLEGFHIEVSSGVVHLGLSTRDRESASDADRDPHPNSKTTFPPHGLDPDPSFVLCCVTVRVIQSSSAMRVVCVLCGAHTRPQLNLDWGSVFNESVFSARVESPLKCILFTKVVFRKCIEFYWSSLFCCSGVTASQIRMEILCALLQNY